MELDKDPFELVIFPNPSQDFIAVQSNLLAKNLELELINEVGQRVQRSSILQGSTLSIIETHTLYNGLYFLKVSDGSSTKTYKVIIDK